MFRVFWDSLCIFHIFISWSYFSEYATQVGQSGKNRRDTEEQADGTKV